MPKNDKTFVNLMRFIEKKEFSNKWQEQPDNKYANELLKHASKANNGKIGWIDYSYINTNKKLLILIELKHSVAQHSNAIQEIQHYLKFFNHISYPDEKQYCKTDKNIQIALEYFKNYKIIGIAISGDLDGETHKIDTFVIDKNTGKISNVELYNINSEEEYMLLFDNIDKEELVAKITDASTCINNKLFHIKEDIRPTLLSILLIALFPSKKINNDFIDDFIHKEPEEIFEYIELTIKKILGPKGENIPQDKINMLLTFVHGFKNEKQLNNDGTIKSILEILKKDVIPLFSLGGNYDIIGKFYQEFLRYAGIVDVKSGIVLTPEHITELFTELIPLEKNDVILDSCCGTGSFLIAGMNKLLSLNNEKKLKEKVKRQQLIGNEIKPHMFILAISNMLFRGDGKSTIFNCDFFSEEFDNEIEKLGNENIYPSVGFINPPYSGDYKNCEELKKDKENTKNDKKKPWMKEISFLEKMCKICSKYVVMIAPPQAYMSENDIRNELLENNTLKAVITMPKDLFQPNASTGSAIIVIKTHCPHNYEQPVVFYNLKSDGFELAKRKGRRDLLNKWANIKKQLLENTDAPYYKNPKNIDNNIFCLNKIEKDIEWTIQAFSKVQWDELKEDNFKHTIKSYSIYKAKREAGKEVLLDRSNDDTKLLDLFEGLDRNEVITKKITQPSCFKEIDIADIFNDPYGCKKKITNKKLRDGEYLYITTSNKNNGVSGYHDEYSETGNVFTIDSATDGRCFFQELPFIGSDHVEILKIKDCYLNKLNIYTACYLTTILNFYLDKYAYERKRAQCRIRKEKLFLPFNKDGIDWNYMEEYIKSLPYSANL